MLVLSFAWSWRAGLSPEVQLGEQWLHPATGSQRVARHDLDSPPIQAASARPAGDCDLRGAGTLPPRSAEGLSAPQKAPSPRSVGPGLGRVFPELLVCRLSLKLGGDAGRGEDTPPCWGQGPRTETHTGREPHSLSLALPGGLEPSGHRTTFLRFFWSLDHLRRPGGKFQASSRDPLAGSGQMPFLWNPGSDGLSLSCWAPGP